MSLFDEVRQRRHIYPAWHKVHAAGARSPSMATRAAVAKFRAGVPRNLERIQEALQRGTFSFHAAKGVPIPREGKDPRPIVVQDVRDRVVQRSILDVVMAQPGLIEAIDTGVSFGGIPKRSVKHALAPICDGVNDGSAKYFIRSDIKSFFRKMPRGKAVEILLGLLSDRSLDDFIGRATTTELTNHAELGHLLDFFPDEITGVPQGHALSALLGNLLLRPLDEAINRHGAFGVRYLDDFLIVAPDKASAWVAFRAGREELASLGLECYSPGKSPKAAEGSAQRMFEFLGCEISRGFVRPSQANRINLVERVELHLDRSRRRMIASGFKGPDSYRDSVATTLLRVSRMVRGWAEQYSFCNYGQVQVKMDADIDELIGRYLGLYSDWRQRSDSDEQRRMVGVWLLADTEEKDSEGESTDSPEAA